MWTFPLYFATVLCYTSRIVLVLLLNMSFVVYKTVYIYILYSKYYTA